MVLTERNPVPIVIKWHLLSCGIFPKRPEGMILKFPILSAKPREGGESVKMSLSYTAKKMF